MFEAMLQKSKETCTTVSFMPDAAENFTGKFLYNPVGVNFCHNTESMKKCSKNIARADQIQKRIGLLLKKLCPTEHE